MPIASTATSRRGDDATPRRLARLRALPGVDVAQHRGARVRGLAARAQRRPTATSARWLLRPRSLQPARRSRRSSPTSTRSIPGAADRARERYACFDHFGDDDTQAYGYAAAFGAGEACERRGGRAAGRAARHAAEYARRDGQIAEDEFFFAEQNARLVRTPRSTTARCSAAATRRGTSATRTWRTRSTRWSATSAARRTPKIVVWAHNSHLGDARATEMGDRGELNVGQLVRERYGRRRPSDRLHHLRRHASPRPRDWDGPAERKRVRPALDGSDRGAVARRRHAAVRAAPATTQRRRPDALRSPRLERAIGVIYRPETERQSHYFQARVAEQFDAMIHVDRSTALVPLEPSPQWWHEESAGDLSLRSLSIRTDECEIRLEPGTECSGSR